MYKINDQNNSINEVEITTFSDLGYKERENLQEWIAKNPEVFGEELLIIQKEFHGFNDTNERLDLLALDKQGNLVVIENKLDDSGRDVIWQVLKYAAYCSTLTKQNIREIFQDYLDKNNLGDSAEEALSEYFNSEDFNELKLNMGNTQRIIMVAANFRKEVTSTTLWLLNYKLRIQCFKVTPYKMNDQKYVNFEQIIPVKDVEEYMISMAEKSQSDIATQEEEKTRHDIRFQFWQQFINEANKRFDVYKNVSPSKDNWISGATGISGVGFNCAISSRGGYGRAEVYISRPEKNENKFIFDILSKRKDEIESNFGSPLMWERLDSKKSSRIKAQMDGVNYFDEEDWPRMIEFMVDSMERLINAFQIPLKEVKTELLQYTENFGS